MDENKGIWGILILIFLFFIVFSGGNGGIFNRGGACGGGYGGEIASGDCVTGKDLLSTMFAMSTQNTNNTEKITAQATLIQQANQSDKLFDLKMENQGLKQMVYSNEKFNSLDRRLDEIQCAMPTRPPYYARGFVPTGQCVPTSCDGSAACGLA